MEFSREFLIENASPDSKMKAVLRRPLEHLYDKVSANGATSKPRCNKKSDGSQDALRGSPNICNQPPDQLLSEYV